VANLMSSGVAIAARSKLRQHPGVQRTLIRLLSLGRSAEVYEHGFKSAMLSCIRPGDCVWDVGANVGFYSELFALAVGPSGKVVSFEPSPACVANLEERLRDRSAGASWAVVPVALSDADGDAWLSLGDGETAPNNHLTNGDDTSAVRVDAVRGDTLLAQGYGQPAVIKIDVEGFEGEVLDGMGTVLAHPSLRAVCVEVHFSQLEERGKPNEPTRIAGLLQAREFNLKWVDRSHFVARRLQPMAEGDR
jgi:FkbM family methyltransferase